MGFPTRMSSNTETIVLEASEAIWDVEFSDVSGLKAKVKLLAQSPESAVPIAKRHLAGQGVPEAELKACSVSVKPHSEGVILATAIRAIIVTNDDVI